MAGKIKAFKPSADAQKKADAIAAFLRAVPKPLDFQDTDEEWVSEALTRFFKDRVRAGRKQLEADASQDLDPTDVI